VDALCAPPSLQARPVFFPPPRAAFNTAAAAATSAASGAYHDFRSFHSCGVGGGFHIFIQI